MVACLYGGVVELLDDDVVECFDKNNRYDFDVVIIHRLDDCLKFYPHTPFGIDY